MKVLVSFLQVAAVLDRECDHPSPQMLIGKLQSLETLKVGRKSLGTAPNSTHRAKQMNFAELRSVKPHSIDRVKVTEYKVIGTRGKPRVFLTQGLLIPDKIRNVECPVFCFSVSIDTLRQSLNTHWSHDLFEQIVAFLLVSHR